jgi:hypothetical protein
MNWCHRERRSASTKLTGIVLFDVFDLATQLEAGRQLLRLRAGSAPSSPARRASTMRW